MTGSFAAHITVGHAAKLFIHQRHQLVEGGLVSFAPFDEQLSN
jgi:hypothetical protein